MKRITALLIVLFGITIVTTTKVDAQMIGFPSSQPDNSAIQAQQQEEQEGKKLSDELNNKTITCQKLTNGNFEKIGEYFMGQSIGDTSKHIAMNNMMKSMMGENGEEQMHIAWGKRGSGCENTSANSSRGVGNSMMGYGMMNWMMGGAYGFGILSYIISLLVIVVLVLLAVFLWKQIQKK